MKRLALSLCLVACGQPSAPPEPEPEVSGLRLRIAEGLLQVEGQDLAQWSVDPRSARLGVSKDLIQALAELRGEFTHAELSVPATAPAAWVRSGAYLIKKAGFETWSFLVPERDVEFGPIQAELRPSVRGKLEVVGVAPHLVLAPRSHAKREWLDISLAFDAVVVVKAMDGSGAKMGERIHVNGRKVPAKTDCHTALPNVDAQGACAQPSSVEDRVTDAPLMVNGPEGCLVQPSAEGQGDPWRPALASGLKALSSEGWGVPIVAIEATTTTLELADLMGALSDAGMALPSIETQLGLPVSDAPNCDGGAPSQDLITLAGGHWLGTQISRRRSRLPPNQR